MRLKKCRCIMLFLVVIMSISLTACSSFEGTPSMEELEEQRTFDLNTRINTYEIDVVRTEAKKAAIFSSLSDVYERENDETHDKYIDMYGSIDTPVMGAEELLNIKANVRSIFLKEEDWSFFADSYENVHLYFSKSLDGLYNDGTWKISNMTDETMTFSDRKGTYELTNEGNEDFLKDGTPSDFIVRYENEEDDVEVVLLYSKTDIQGEYIHMTVIHDKGWSSKTSEDIDIGISEIGMNVPNATSDSSENISSNIDHTDSAKGDRLELFDKDNMDVSKSETEDNAGMPFDLCYLLTWDSEECDDTTYYDIIQFHGGYTNAEERLCYTVKYSLDGNYKTVSGTQFETYYPDSEIFAGYLIFYGDGEELFATDRMTSSSSPQTFSFDVSGIDELTLEYYGDTTHDLYVSELIAE